jgi:hypothetical protein
MKNILRHLKSDWYRYVLETLVVIVGILIAFSLNNWNEERKERLLEEQLKKNLYNELIDVLAYNKEVLSSEFDIQIQHLNHLLSDEGREFNYEDFINQTGDYWAVKKFSLITYVLSYTAFYDPNFKYYKSAVNDGSISILKDKEFVNDLEFIYINGPARIDRLYNKEVELNQEIQRYISHKYPEIFTNKSIVNAIWSNDTTRELLEKIANDGTYRFLLQLKMSSLKSKRFIMDSHIIPVMERILKSY